MNARSATILFAKKWKEKYDAPYAVVWSKHPSMFKRLLEFYSPRDLEGMMDAYFVDSSDFVKNAGHTVEVFVTRIPALIASNKKRAAEKSDGVSGGNPDYERLKEQREKASDVTFDDEVDSDEATSGGET